MYNNNPHLEAGEDYIGLGFWSALIPIGVSVVGSAFGGGDDIDKRDYYNGAKSRIFCPERSPVGASPPGYVVQGFDELGAMESLRQEINANLLSDRTWDELGIARPRTAREKMHVLINGGNGWRYCPEGEALGPKDSMQRRLVERVVVAEGARRRTLEARAQALAAGAQELATAQIIPGVSTPLLALGAAGLAAAFFLRR